MMQHLDTAVRFTIATLLGGLWQAPLFALTAWLILRLAPKANATTRHSVLATALFASLALPVVTAGLSLRHVPVPYKPAAVKPSLPTRSHALDAYDSRAYAPANYGAPSAALSVPSLPRFNLAIPRWVAFVAAGLWFAGSAFVLLRLLLSLLHLEGLKRDALPLPVDYRERLTRWNAVTKGGRAVRLCVSDEIEIPIAVGLFDSMILIPKRLLEELEPHDVDSIVLHELAHLRRSDDWLNAIERVALALQFFNPGILWLASQLDLEREVACDDWVLQQNDALPYATCLAKVAETTSWPYRAVSAPGAFVTRRGMSIRIERLLSKQRDVRVRTSLGPAGASAALLVGLGVVAAAVSPSIAYDIPTQPSVAAVPAVPIPPAPAVPSAPAVAKASAGRKIDVSVTTRQTGPSIVRTERVMIAQADVTPAPIKPNPHPHGNPHPCPAPPCPTRHDHSQPTFPSTPAWPAQPAPPAQPNAGTWNPSDGLASSEKAAAAAAKMEAQAARAESRADREEALADQRQERASAKADVVADANDPDFIDELANAGYTNLSVDQLVQLKSVGVDADYVRAMKRAGMSHPSVDELVQLRAVGVDPAFVGAMRRHFGGNLDAGTIVSLKAVGVSSAYVQELSDLGIKDLSADDVRSLRAVGVSPKYIRDISRAGYPHLSAQDISQLKALGIDAGFIARAAAHGFRGLSTQDLVKLKATGVL